MRTPLEMTGGKGAYGQLALNVAPARWDAALEARARLYQQQPLAWASGCLNRGPPLILRHPEGSESGQAAKPDDGTS